MMGGQPQQLSTLEMELEWLKVRNVTWPLMHTACLVRNWVGMVGPAHSHTHELAEFLGPSGAGCSVEVNEVLGVVSCHHHDQHSSTVLCTTLCTMCKQAAGQLTPSMCLVLAGKAQAG